MSPVWAIYFTFIVDRKNRSERPQPGTLRIRETDSRWAGYVRNMADSRRDEAAAVGGMWSTNRRVPTSPTPAV